MYPFRSEGSEILLRPQPIFCFDFSRTGSEAGAVDWSQTALGDSRSWGLPMRLSLAQLFRNPHPQLLFWGADDHAFYNDAFRQAFPEHASVHALGQKAQIPFSNNWMALKNELDAVRNQQWVNRYRAVSEFMTTATSQSYFLTPQFDEHGKVAGVLMECLDIFQNDAKDTKFLAHLNTVLEQKNRHLEKSRQDFVDFFLQAPAAMAILSGPEHRFTMVNPLYEQLVNRKVVGTTVLESFTMDEVASFIPLLDHVYREGDMFIGKEMLFSIKDSGRKRDMYLNINYSPFRDRDGTITGVLVFVQDTTEQVLTRMRLEEAEVKFRALANSLPIMVWSALPDGSINFYNERWYDYFGLPHEPTATASWHFYVHSDDKTGVMDAWRHSCATGETFAYELRMYCTVLEEYRWVRAQAVPVGDEAGAIKQWYGTTTDIHDTKLMIEELNSARATAESANLAKSSFLANMSHEIRTPLSAILGFAKIMKDCTKKYQRDKYYKIIARNGQSLAKLIDDILDLTKVEAGHLELEHNDFRLDVFIQELFEEFREIALKKGITLSLTMADDVPRAIRSDANRIRQILVNLIGNAIKFTSKGSIQIEILSTDIDADKKTLTFKIKDSGVGMTGKQAERLFKPFAQADSSMTRKFGGTGLGLALSRRVAQALKGDVFIEKCAPGEGCTFVATVEIGSSDLDLADKSPGPIAESSSVLTGAHILVVDDAPDNRLLVELVLTMAGMNVEVATNGAEATEMAEKGSFDLILMDMQMPVLDGYAATRYLRRRGYTKPILALSAHVMNDDRKRTFEAGCDAHLSKPLNPDILLRKIREFCRPHLH